ncbi:MAG: NAD-dependent epimerase/dehydratase family protein [Hormoscilla sp. GM7CHS1pb]|nr:NAD-dependent epimerase/dehydratase family protein [Hormoscilla sp. GM7CHS1pb]
MKILVTGASGHLGANLVRRLLDDGQSVRVLLREGSNNTAVESLDVERVYGDLRDFTGMKAAVRGCDRIYHCAAKVSTLDGDTLLKREIYDCNVLGTLHILQAALEAGVSKVVVSGSFSAVGHNPEKPSDETVPFYPFSPHLPYGFTKTFVEHECLKAFANGLNVVVAVSCAIIGPMITNLPAWGEHF